MPTNISPSESEGAKWMKLQLWVRQACENAGITAGGDDPLLSDISPSDSEGVKWAKLQRWVALLAENISGGGGGGGNAATATALKTARTLTIGSTGKTFDGSANVAWTLAEIGADPSGTAATAVSTHNTATDSHADIRADLADAVSTHNTATDAHADIRTALAGKQDAGNFAGSSTPGGAATTALECTGNAATATTAASCTGNSATATTASSCSGNAATATALQTARTINGVSFDGTANITVPAAKIITNIDEDYETPELTQNTKLYFAPSQDRSCDITAGAASVGIRLFLYHSGSGNFKETVTYATGRSITLHYNEYVLFCWNGTSWDTIASTQYGTTSVSITTADVTLYNAQYISNTIILSGTLTGNRNLILPNDIREYKIINNCSGNYYVLIKTSSGTGVYMAPGDTWDTYCDGANIVPIRLSAPRIITGTRSTTQSITTHTTVVIDWTTVTGDSLGEMSSGVFTAKNPGTYAIMAELVLKADESIVSPQVIICQNGGRIARSMGANLGTTMDLTISTDTYLAAGDKIEIRAYHESGTDITTIQSSRLMIKQIS